MGPLNGTTVIEFAAIGPVPFCGQLLGDLGADVIVVERTDDVPSIRPRQVSGRSRRSVAVDVKHPDGLEIVKRLVAIGDVLLEGFRPGVMERLGLGPDVCAELNPRLVYGRMTGWGQEGPMATMAGHDINYLSMIGALDSIGPPEQPIPPLNLVGDYGGGALYLALGVLAGLVERIGSGRGQVVDAAMVDGAASLMDVFYTLDSLDTHDGPRGTNFLDGGAPFYRTYATADGGFMAVGALEPQFYAELLAGLGLDGGELPAQWDTAGWPELSERFAAVFADADRAHWTARFTGTDACVTPVLGRTEALADPHNTARRVFDAVGGAVAPRPAPRFSRSAAGPSRATPALGAHTDEVLEMLGFGPDERTRLRSDGRVR